MKTNLLGHLDGVKMNALTDVAQAREFAVAIEAYEAEARCEPVEIVRPDVARHLGVSATTLENLRRRRLKTIPSWFMSKLRSEFVRVLQAEIRKLEHEIHICQQTGAHHSDDDLQAAAAQVVAAKQILEAAR